MSLTFREVTISHEEAVIALIYLEKFRKDTVVDNFPFTLSAGRYKTGLTDIYIYI